MMHRLSMALALAFFPSLAQAARPLVTDDARLTTAHSCQLESWVRTHGGRQEVWALPACNPAGNFEITAGVGHVVGDELGANADVMVQAKTLFRPLKTNDWGIGLAAGMMHHHGPNPGANGFGNIYVYVPVSVSFAHDAFILHTNIGWMKSRGDSHAMSLGLGTESRISRRLVLVAEVYGDPRYAPYAQMGLRYFIVKDRVQVDATIGQQTDRGAAGRWFSIGLRLTPEKIF